MRPVVLLLFPLLVLPPGCAARGRVGAGLAVVGLHMGVAGAVVAADHCEPDPDNCRRVRPGDPDVGLPVAAAGALLFLGGAALVLDDAASGSDPDEAAPFVDGSSPASQRDLRPEYPTF